MAKHKWVRPEVPFLNKPELSSHGAAVMVVSGVIALAGMMLELENPLHSLLMIVVGSFGATAGLMLAVTGISLDSL